MISKAYVLLYLYHEIIWGLRGFLIDFLLVEFPIFFGNPSSATAISNLYSNIHSFGTLENVRYWIKAPPDLSTANLLAIKMSFLKALVGDVGLIRRKLEFPSVDPSPLHLLANTFTPPRNPDVAPAITGGGLKSSLALINGRSPHLFYQAFSQYLRFPSFRILAPTIPRELRVSHQQLQH